MSNFGNWKADNYKFVGKAFDYAYADRMKKLSPIVGEVNAKSIDYELTGSGGYGEMPGYDGYNLNMGALHRGFKTIIRPEEFSLSIPVRYKEAKIDKMGETRKVGSKLGETAFMTVYMHTLAMFANAWNADGKHNGGDGVPWASAAHPVASLGSSGRSFIADPDAGTYSNSVSKDLTVAAITELQAMAMGFVTPDGLPFLAEMDTLLVSPQLAGEAAKICGPNNQLAPERDPSSDTNAANPVYGLKYMVVGGGGGGFSGKQWALCDAKLMKEIVNVVYNTRPTVLPSEQLDNPLIDLYTAYADFGAGWGDARQIIFSNK